MKIAVAAIALLVMSHCGARSDEPTCQQLRDLRAQYRGVTLNADQHAMAAKMRAWYRANCRRKK